MRKLSDIPYVDDGNERHLFDLYLPDFDTNDCLIYIHGGGIEGGKKSDNARLGLKPLVDSGIAVAMINYRLFPEAKYPDFIEDCQVASKKIRAMFSGRLFLGGSSAGGYITMMLYFDRKFGLKQSDFDGFIFDAGQPTTHFNVLKYRGVDPRSCIIDEMSPIFHIKEYDGEKPILVIASDHDMKARLEQTKLMLETLDHFNYPKNIITFKLMENTTHCSYIKDEIFGKIILEFIEKLKTF